MNKEKTLLKNHKKLYLFSSNPKPKFSFYKDLKNHCRTITCQKISKPKSNLILYSNNPYDDITTQEIPVLIQRLNDPPEQIYQAIKIRRNNDFKYKLLFRQTQRVNVPAQKEYSMGSKSKSQHLLPQQSNCLETKRSKMHQKIEIQKERIQILKQNIKKKRIMYEQQYKKIFQNKKNLQITTDLPKISRIRQDSITKKYILLAECTNSTNKKSTKNFR